MLGSQPQAEHQDGVCGHVHLRLVGSLEAASLRRCSLALEGLGRAVAPLCDALEMRIAVPKEASTTMLSIEIKDRSRGLASMVVDVRTLLLGDVPNARCSLRVHEVSLHFVLDYRPHGLEPRRGHVVRLEPFAEACALPRDGFMVVEDDVVVSMPLVAFDEVVEVDVGVVETWKCRARVHRNQIFVVDRRTWADHFFTSSLVARAAHVARPAAAIAAPLIHLSWSSITALGSTLARATLAAAKRRCEAGLGSCRRPS